ncbi:TorD/DmsD family molecular chaperone [Stygiolobus caldivivus]|uniref:Component of anaerobic dehydrogenase n=1 Tax=Stygiolobus caldivivus TaxID=2824673 RepID=A0A8D5U906_9CREN|nr:molecular chaperone TorD family protein [Stygiolobus caldivivus]BCU70914.1 component of anaerobic dehydrogenase [Stygiolobus caldivivus]
MSLSTLDQASLRFLLYDLFSTLFYYNFHEEDYTKMREKLEKVSSLGIDKDAVDVGRIKDVVLNSAKSELLIEYSTLFLTGLGVKPLTPVESKRFFSLMGEKVASFRYNDILRFLRSRNVRLNYMLGEFQPEPDNIVTILAFMSVLIKEEITILQKGGDIYKNRADQRNFFTTHIYSWIPDWANDVINDKRANIYRVVCEELRKWLEVEREYLIGEGN